jgi:hypothetical protein
MELYRSKSEENAGVALLPPGIFPGVTGKI